MSDPGAPAPGSIPHPRSSRLPLGIPSGRQRAPSPTTCVDLSVPSLSPTREEKASLVPGRSWPSESPAEVTCTRAA